ncbi:MAG: CHAT domain-containing protein [Bacteroidota bacterium]
MFPYLKHSEKFIHPPIDSINKYEEIFFNLAFLTAEIFQAQAKANQDKRKVQLAMENIEYAEQILLKRLKLIKTESDRFILVEDSYKTYELGMQILHLAFSDNPSSTLLEKALQWMEKSKAFGLKKNLATHLKNSAPSKGFQVESLQKKLQAEMAIYKEKVTRRRISPIMDTLQVFSWEDSLFELTRTYDSLFFRIQNSLSSPQPDNVSLKLPELQLSLRSQQHLLSYFISESTLHRIYMGKNFVVWDTTQLPQNFEKLVQKHVANFSDWKEQKDRVKDTTNLVNFASESHLLYNLLIPPKLDSLLQGITNKTASLIVIPDGVIGLVPFEWLVRIPPAKNKLGTFGQLDFMGNYLPIHLEYSGSFKANKIGTKAKARYTFGGFAPSYGKGGLISSERGLPGQRVIDNMKGMSSGAPITELLFSQQETRQISKLLESHSLTGKAVTRNLFKQVASNYDILHLSMHGYSDPVDPKLSGLIFSPCKEGASCEEKNIQEEDLHEAILYAFEIANLDLDARLVVLSACQTGTGKIQKGEGIMSLARAFALAGVPSQIVSLWNVDDQATLLLFTEFYKHLLSGDAKDVSLWKAKQVLKADPKYAHPYFWSAFVLIGDESPMPDIKAARFWQKWRLKIILVCIGTLMAAYTLKRVFPKPSQAN